jgi:hypothetical protein
LVDREVLVVANTSATSTFSGSVIVDRDLNAVARLMQVAFSNLNTGGTGTVQQIGTARFFSPGGVSIGPAAGIPVLLGPSEIQILAPL